MANPHKGEVSFEVNDKTYMLKFSIDALASLECEFGKLEGKGKVPARQIFQELSDPERMSISGVRLALWAGLQEHHPRMTIKAAGELIVPAGGTNKIIGLIADAVVLAFPQAEESPQESTGDEASERPSMPSQNGTGSASQHPG